MANALKSLRGALAGGLDALKSFSPAALGSGGMVGGYGSRGGGCGPGGGLGYRLPGTQTNWAALAGDLWQNSAVAACLNWQITAFPEAPPRLMERQDTGKVAVVTDDPLGITGLFVSPNQDYDDTVLWAGTLISFAVSGNAYWFIVRDGAGRVKELWYAPHFQVFPRWDGADFISYYEYRANGQSQRMEKEDVIHFRFGVDPYNPRLGMAPLASIVREVYTDTQATNYTAAILRNSGVAGVIISPKNSEETQLDPETVARMYQAKTSGDRTGEAFVVDQPLDVVFPNNSPERMALDTIRKYPEARICAVIGIPAMVVGLNVGLERSTFANYAEARSAAWEDCLLPTMRILGRQATKQLLHGSRPGSQVPNFAGGDKYEIGFDTREVRALAQDVDAAHTRAREDFKANLLTRAEAKAEVGVGADGDKADEVYYADIAPAGSGGFDKPVTAGELTTALNGANGKH